MRTRSRSRSARENWAGAQGLCRRDGPAVPGRLERLEISYDDFIQTSEERHHIGCRKFIQAVHDAGDIYKGVYAGHYCTGCESFKTEKEVEEAGGNCPNHPEYAADAGSRKRTTFFGSPPIATDCWHTTRRTLTSFSPPAGGTRSQPGRDRAQGCRHHAQRIYLGNQGPVRPRTDHLRLV